MAKMRFSLALFSLHLLWLPFNWYQFLCNLLQSRWFHWNENLQWFSRLILLQQSWSLQLFCSSLNGFNLLKYISSRKYGSFGLPQQKEVQENEKARGKKILIISSKWVFYCAMMKTWRFSLFSFISINSKIKC